MLIEDQWPRIVDELGGLDVEHLHVGCCGDESFHRRQNLSEVPVALGDDCHCDRAALPLVLMIDLRNRDPEPVAETINDRADCGALGLERAALGNVEVEACGGRVHDPYCAGLPCLLMHRFRRIALASAVATALVASISLPAPAGAAASVSLDARRSRKLATEVCEKMVGDAIEASIEGKLAAPQQGGWQGDTYVCTYNVGDGSIVLGVRVLATTTGAKALYRRTLKAATVDQKFNGLGQESFQAKNATITARKDRFVLTADPTLLPPRLNKRDVAFAAVAAVLSCWTGESS